MPVRIADIEITAAIGLVLGLPVELNAARGQFRGHGVDVIDVEV